MTTLTAAQAQRVLDDIREDDNMASTTMKIQAPDLLKTATVQVEIVGNIFGWFSWRRHLAVGLMRVAGAVLRMQVEISNAG